MAVSSRQDEFFDELETMSPAARQKYLDRKLAETVAYAYQHAPAVKKLLDKAGVSPEQIRTVKDLEKLPITRKTDLLEMQKADLPYGGVLAMPAEDVERVFISPGPIYEIQPSSIKWFAKSFWAAGFRKGDVVINTFTYHMSPAGILFHEGYPRLRGDGGGGRHRQYRPPDTDYERPQGYRLRGHAQLSNDRYQAGRGNGA